MNYQIRKGFRACVLKKKSSFNLKYRCRLCRVHRRIAKGFEVLEYYANNQWDFDNAAILYLRTKMNAEEKVKFKIDAAGTEGD